MYRGTFELIPTAGVAAPVIAYSPVYKIDHYDYKYNVTADKLAGAATASLYIYVEPHDSTVIIEVGGQFRQPTRGTNSEAHYSVVCLIQLSCISVAMFCFVVFCSSV